MNPHSREAPQPGARVHLKAALRARVDSRGGRVSYLAAALDAHNPPSLTPAAMSLAPAFIAVTLAFAVTAFAAPGERCIVIDPGHGGARALDESSANNATSPSGVKEKDLALEIGRAVFAAIRDSEAAKKANIVPVLTRDADVNVGMAERAGIALAHSAKAFVSIHFNASATHTARGPLGMVQDAARGNEHAARDGEFANRLADAVSAVTRRYDPKSLRHGFQTDRDIKGGRGSFLFHHLRAKPDGQSIPACFLEIEFIDNAEVEAWLIGGDGAKAIRAEIAQALAVALIEYVSGEMSKE